MASSRAKAAGYLSPAAQRSSPTPARPMYARTRETADAVFRIQQTRGSPPGPGSAPSSREASSSTAANDAAENRAAGVEYDPFSSVAAPFTEDDPDFEILKLQHALRLAATETVQLREAAASKAKDVDTMTKKVASLTTSMTEANAAAAAMQKALKEVTERANTDVLAAAATVAAIRNEAATAAAASAQTIQELHAALEARNKAAAAAAIEADARREEALKDAQAKADAELMRLHARMSELTSDLARELAGAKAAANAQLEEAVAAVTLRLTREMEDQTTVLRNERAAVAATLRKEREEHVDEMRRVREVHDAQLATERSDAAQRMTFAEADLARARTQLVADVETAQAALATARADVKRLQAELQERDASHAAALRDADAAQAASLASMSSQLEAALTMAKERMGMEVKRLQDHAEEEVQRVKQQAAADIAIAQQRAAEEVARAQQMAAAEVNRMHRLVSEDVGQLQARADEAVRTAREQAAAAQSAATAGTASMAEQLAGAQMELEAQARAFSQQLEAQQAASAAEMRATVERLEARAAAAAAAHASALQAAITRNSDIAAAYEDGMAQLRAAHGEDLAVLTAKVDALLRAAKEEAHDATSALQARAEAMLAEKIEALRADKQRELDAMRETCRTAIAAASAQHADASAAQDAAYRNALAEMEKAHSAAISALQASHAAAVQEAQQRGEALAESVKASIANASQKNMDEMRAVYMERNAFLSKQLLESADALESMRQRLEATRESLPAPAHVALQQLASTQEMLREKMQAHQREVAELQALHDRDAKAAADALALHQQRLVAEKGVALAESRIASSDALKDAKMAHMAAVHELEMQLASARRERDAALEKLTAVGDSTHAALQRAIQECKVQCATEVERLHASFQSAGDAARAAAAAREAELRASASLREAEAATRFQDMITALQQGQQGATPSSALTAADTVEEQLRTLSLEYGAALRAATAACKAQADEECAALAAACDAKMAAARTEIATLRAQVGALQTAAAVLPSHAWSTRAGTSPAASRVLLLADGAANPARSGNGSTVQAGAKATPSTGTPRKVIESQADGNNVSEEALFTLVDSHRAAMQQVAQEHASDLQTVLAQVTRLTSVIEAQSSGDAATAAARAAATRAERDVEHLSSELRAARGQVHALGARTSQLEAQLRLAADAAPLAHDADTVLSQIVESHLAELTDLRTTHEQEVEALRSALRSIGTADAGSGHLQQHVVSLTLLLDSWRDKAVSTAADLRAAEAAARSEMTRVQADAAAAMHSHSEHLRRITTAHDAQLQALQRTAEADLQRAHADTLREVARAVASATASTRAAAQADAKRDSDALLAQVEMLKRERDSFVSRLSQENVARVEALNAQTETAVAALRAAHTSRVEEILSDAEAAQVDLRAHFEAHLKSLTVARDSAVAEAARLRGRDSALSAHAAMLERDRDTAVAAHASCATVIAGLEAERDREVAAHDVTRASALREQRELQRVLQSTSLALTRAETAAARAGEEAAMRVQAIQQSASSAARMRDMELHRAKSVAANATRQLEELGARLRALEREHIALQHERSIGNNNVDAVQAQATQMRAELEAAQTVITALTAQFRGGAAVTSVASNDGHAGANTSTRAAGQSTAPDVLAAVTGVSEGGDLSERSGPALSATAELPVVPAAFPAYTPPLAQVPDLRDLHVDVSPAARSGTPRFRSLSQLRSPPSPHTTLLRAPSPRLGTNDFAQGESGWPSLSPSSAVARTKSALRERATDHAARQVLKHGARPTPTGTPRMR